VTGDNCAIPQSCTGTVLDYCGSDGLRFTIECAAQGHTCGLDAMSGNLDCLTEGKLDNCSGYQTTCNSDKTKVHQCDAYHGSLFDCAGIGAVCNDDQATARCVRPTDACTPFDTGVNQCADAKTLSLCVGGEKVAFDCSSIGRKCTGVAPTAGCL
jgi:hypothetical protein